VETDGVQVEVRGWRSQRTVLTAVPSAHTKTRRHEDAKDLR
jgi:hypothetical protein